MEGAGVHHAAELLGHDRGVDQSLARHAPAAVLLGHEHGVPPQLAALTPHLAVEADGVVDQLAHTGEGTALLERPPARLAEQLLILGKTDLHALVS